jgi:hypothetical protein
MNPSDNACAFLDSLQRSDLSTLVRACRVSLDRSEVDDGFWGSNLIEQAVLEAPAPVNDALEALPDQDRKRIAEAIASEYIDRKAPDDIVVRNSGGTATGAVSLLSELLIHRAMMISVATGGPRIQEVDDYYRAREVRIREQMPESIKYENPHKDLWDWYRHWSQHLPAYRDRRQFIRQMFSPAIDAVAARPSASPQVREPTGWDRVDRALSTARAQFEKASATEDFQTIGLLCREIIISLAQAVFLPEKHKMLDDIKASDTDANRMLEAYLAHEFSGASYKEVRAHEKASLALALNLQHRRTATKQLAALCLEATASTTAVISIIARSNKPAGA